MATDVLKMNGCCQDEVGRVVAAAATTWETEQDRAEKYDALLPLERSSIEGPIVAAHLIDPDLAAEYQIVDYAAIMAKMRLRRWRLPLPFFAAYDLKDSSATCEIKYHRGSRGVENLSAETRINSRHYFSPYPEASLRKMQSTISSWESVALVRAMVLTGLIVFGLVGVFLYFLPAPWLLLLIVSTLAGSTASTLTATIPWNDGTLRFRTSFAGVLPNEVRQKLISVRDKFDCIVIVQEVNAKDWAVSKIPKPKAADPLAIGFKNGVAYLICQFLTTPAEHYMASELAARA